MKASTALSSDVSSAQRLDAKFFAEEGFQAHKSLTALSCEMVKAGDYLGNQNFWMPNRFNRAFAADAHEGKPFLAPYDTLRFIPPRQAPILSRSQNKSFDDCERKRGWMLIVRSGRNLGPPTMVDKTLAPYALSDDMIRISRDMDERSLYLFAYLHTRVGRVMVRRDRSGSVIDHLDPSDIADLALPILPQVLKHIVPEFQTAFSLREEARALIINAAARFTAAKGWATESKSSTHASVRKLELRNRIDAEPYMPRYVAIQNRLTADNEFCTLGDLAYVTKPPGRYKTVYVQNEQYGIKLMSGRNISQVRPVNLKIMSPDAFDNVADYIVEPGTTLITSDGRAEENLADCVYVTEDRSGWLASGHVHRLSPKKGVHPGLLYLLASSDYCQAQFKGLATGSVIDALSESDVASVLVSSEMTPHIKTIADDAVLAWEKFSDASKFEDDAAEEFNQLLEKPWRPKLVAI